MKKITLLVSCAFITSAMFSQIPNFSFEDWTDMGTYMTPMQWDNLNSMTEGDEIFTCEQGTPGSPGASYLKLTSKTDGAFVAKGIAVSGVLDTYTMEAVSGFPFTARPETFDGKWQHMIFGTSQGYIDVKLTRWDNFLNMPVEIASLHKTLTGMAMSWAAFSYDLVYESDLFPDTCIITLSASGDVPANNDYLWVDNLSFEGEVSGTTDIKEINSDLISVYPNPVSEILFVNNESLIVDANYFITDITGNKILSGIINGNNFSIDISELAQGTYLFSAGEDFNYTQIFIKE